MQKRAWRSVCLGEMPPRRPQPSDTVAEEKILTRAIAEAALAAIKEEVGSRYPKEEGDILFAVSLRGYTCIEEDAAEILGKCGYSLDLGGLSAISAAVAWSLGAQVGVRLVLDGLTALEPDAALGLAGFRGDLELSGLTDLPDEVACGLARFRGNNLSLGGLAELHTAAARALSTSWSQGISLKGLTKLSPAAAHALAGYTGWLGLNGLVELSEGAARALAAGHLAGIDLNGLTALSDEAMQALATMDVWLRLDGLTELSDAAAHALSQHRHGVFLRGLRSVSDVAARALARKDGAPVLRDLREIGGRRLGELTQLSDEQADFLSCVEGVVDLSGLKDLSETAARALASQPFSTLYLDGLPHLSEAVARALAHHEGKTSLKGLATMPAAVAEALGCHEGPIFLPPPAT